MIISRRSFLDYCTKALGGIGVGVALGDLEHLLANPTAPPVIWLQGATCAGCSVSFLNYISSSPPASAADVLITSINLLYHPTLMGAQGDAAYGIIQNVISAGGYILVVEGGIPTGFNGNACTVWDANGTPVTCKNAVVSLAAKASKILCVGACASFGGVPHVPPNPAGIVSVASATSKPTINIAGCPPHPNWIVWGIANAIANTVGSLDAYGRPMALYAPPPNSQRVFIHGYDPREILPRVTTYGLDNTCLKYLGCKGNQTYAQCPFTKWNNAVNWCTDANSICLGCTNPTFPGSAGYPSGTAPLRIQTT